MESSHIVEFQWVVEHLMSPAAVTEGFYFYIIVVLAFSSWISLDVQSTAKNLFINDHKLELKLRTTDSTELVQRWKYMSATKSGERWREHLAGTNWCRIFELVKDWGHDSLWWLTKRDERKDSFSNTLFQEAWMHFPSSRVHGKKT